MGGLPEQRQSRGCKDPTAWRAARFWSAVPPGVMAPLPCQSGLITKIVSASDIPSPPPAQSALFCVDSREHTEVWLCRPPYTVDGEPKSVSSRGGTLLVSKLCRRPQSMLTPSPAINRTKALPNPERGRLRTKASCRDSNL